MAHSRPFYSGQAANFSAYYSLTENWQKCSIILPGVLSSRLPRRIFFRDVHRLWQAIFRKFRRIWRIKYSAMIRALYILV